MTLLPIACALVLAVTAEPPAAETEAIARAEQAFLAGDYAEAVRGFADAYAITPQPKYLWAQAQAARLADDCAHAIDLYTKFLATGPPPQPAADARENRATCEEKLQAQRKPPPPADPKPVDTPATEPAPIVDEPPSKRPWYRDPWGGALVGSGALVGGVGIGLMVSAVRIDRNARDADTEGAYVTERDGAVVRHRVGIATIAIGSALVVAGIVRWVWVGTRNKRHAALAPSPTGVAIIGRF